jgi:hypothetical protein
MTPWPRRISLLFEGAGSGVFYFLGKERLGEKGTTDSSIPPLLQDRHHFRWLLPGP